MEPDFPELAVGGPTVDRPSAGDAEPTGGADPAGGSVAPDVPSDPDSESVDRQFWLSHMRIGFAVFLTEGLAVAGYLSLTASGPHRPVLWTTTALWLVLGGVNLLSTGWVAARPWRGAFSLGWTVLSALAVGGVVVLDGGLASPLAYLFFLPVSYAAWAFSPTGAAVCGGATIATVSSLAVWQRGRALPAGQVLMLFAVLGGAGVLATSAAWNRARREAREAHLAAQVAWLASTDTLTGCAVRRVFHERLHSEVKGCERHDRDLTLMMIDVDRFKGVNDTYGHHVGDQVLARLGEVLRSETRASDLAARLGGDEFAVLMPDTDPASALAVASRIRRGVERLPGLDVTVSIGVGALNGAAPSAEQLLDDADFALYESKHRGRDSVSIRDPNSTRSATPAVPRP